MVLQERDVKQPDTMSIMMEQKNARENLHTILTIHLDIMRPLMIYVRKAMQTAVHIWGIIRKCLFW